MRNYSLSTTLIPLALTTACSLASDQTDDMLLGDCGSAPCEDNGSDGDGHGGGDDCDDGGGTCGGGGSSGDGDGVDLDIDLDASVSIEVVGTGIYVGLFPLGCLDVSGDFAAHASASASFNGDTWLLAEVAAAASIDIGDGCSCSGLDINAIAAINVSASIDANVTSCHKACADKGSSCESACNQDGNTIVATASLDANACASVGIGGELNLDALVGLAVDLELTAILDVSGNIVVEL